MKTLIIAAIMIVTLGQNTRLDPAGNIRDLEGVDVPDGISSATDPYFDVYPVEPGLGEEES